MLTADNLDNNYASAPVTAMARGIMFSGHLILVNAVSQERPEGISSNLKQMTSWTKQPSIWIS